MTQIVIGDSVEIDPANIIVGEPVYIESLNIFTSWSYNTPVTGNTVYLPAIIVNNISEVPADLPAGTAVLVRAT